MSKFTNMCENRADMRRKLLASASAIVLVGCVYGASDAHAADSDRPPLWIDLGGLFVQQDYNQEAFLPSFSVATPRPPFIVASPDQVQKMPPTSWDGTTKVSFEPAGTGWVFSASVLIGKSNRHRFAIQQTLQSVNAIYAASQITTSKNSERHTVVDFDVGKDVGLGMFGVNGSSLVSLGVRYAQFNVGSNASIRSQPTNAVSPIPYNRFYATFSETRKFAGAGPSLSWNASAGLAGNPDTGEIMFDWGVNAAVLFGHQNVRGHHEVTNNYFTHYIGGHLAYHTSASPARSKNVTVPNLGGFAGLSWRTVNAKVSIGYRADMFFNAMDGGIDVAKKENRGFHGPYASISIGLGD